MFLKRIVTVAISALLFFSVTGIIACGSDNGLKVTYNVEEKVIAISGNLDKAEPSVVVAITAYSDEGNVFDDENLPYIIKLVPVETDGRVDFEIPAGTYLSSGKYSAYFSRENENMLQSDFMLVNPDDSKTLAALDLIKGKRDAVSFGNAVFDNAYALGLDKDRIKTSHFSYACEAAYKNKNAISSPQDFYNIFSGFVAVAMICDNDIENAVSQYSSSLKTDVNEFESYSKSCLDELTSLIVKKSSGYDLPWIIYNDASITAQIKSADNWKEMKSFAQKYADDIKIDISAGSKYDSLSADKKSSVFVEMYRLIDRCETIADIKDVFDKALDMVSSKKPSGTNGGGGGSGSSGFPSQISSDSNILVPSAEDINRVLFNDISDHFARDYILKLSEMKIISGYPDGSYKPDNFVSRAEFAKIICLGFGYDKSGDCRFADVESTDWYAPYISALAAENIILGYNGYFRPGDTLTREDAAVIISRVRDFDNLSDVSGYLDRDAISDYALEAVGKLSVAGVIKGDGTNFRPGSNITRGEVAAVIGRILSE